MKARKDNITNKTWESEIRIMFPLRTAWEASLLLVINKSSCGKVKDNQMHWLRNPATLTLLFRRLHVLKSEVICSMQNRNNGSKWLYLLSEFLRSTDTNSCIPVTRLLQEKDHSLLHTSWMCSRKEKWKQVKAEVGCSLGESWVYLLCRRSREQERGLCSRKSASLCPEDRKSHWNRQS